MDMIRRMSNQQRPSQAIQARLSQQQVRLSQVGLAQDRPSLMVPNEAFGGMMQGPGITDRFGGLGAPPASNMPPEVSPIAAYELRRNAEESDKNAMRYSALIQHSATLVSEVKSALYDADHAGQPYGAEVLLEEVRDMLSTVTQKTLAEAATLQKSSEQWLGVRKKLTLGLRANQQALDSLLRRRAILARGSNEERRAECDRLWKDIRDQEAELERMPARLRVAGPLNGSPLSPMSNMSDPADPGSPQLSGGLTLEGAHTLLRSFSSVLRPHMTRIIPKQAERRSPSEAVALEFLTACNESVQQAAPPATSSPSSPPIEELAPRIKRCDSTPSVFFGDRVETTKIAGLIPLPKSGPSASADELLEAEQREKMLSKIGISY